MGTKEEILELIEDFFKRTCINKYCFRDAEQNNFIKVKKKTPIGSWKIKTVEIGYFIDHQDQITIGILSDEKDDLHHIVRKILKKHAENFRNRDEI